LANLLAGADDPVGAWTVEHLGLDTSSYRREPG
jgi:hypothetical protein